VGEQVHHLATELYVLEDEPGAGRQQLLRTHRPPFGWPGDPPGRRGLPGQGRRPQALCQVLTRAAVGQSTCPLHGKESAPEP